MKKTHQIPGQRDLYWPVIQAFRELQSSSRQPQLVEKVCELINLSEEDTSFLRGDGPGTEISYRISWVKDTLKRMGILATPERGLWTLTRRGRTIKEKDVKVLYDENRKLSMEKRKANAGSDDGAASEVEPAASENIDEQWKVEILEAVRSMDPKAFERLTKLLLAKSGFDDLVVTKSSHDKGIDVKGVIREGNGIIRRPVFVQCKRHSEYNTVGIDLIERFKGSIDKGVLHVTGIFITSGSYTKSAREAAVDGMNTIHLVDGDKLAEMLKDARLGVEVEEEIHEIVTVKKDYFKREV